ncbi:MAG TPA: hypothetical protein VK404_13220 [Spirosoma sp.]|nr:hypothetical protein [Spirosoma sp.]
MIAIAICLLSLPVAGWSQSESPNTIIKTDCPSLPDLNLIDSTIIRNDIASGYVQLSGRWQWVELRGGWGHVTKVTRLVEMMVGQQGQGSIYENGQYRSAYQLKLRRTNNHFYFLLSEKGQPFFNFRNDNQSGYLRVCNEFLIIGEAIGDGREWVFKRIIAKLPRTN